MKNIHDTKRRPLDRYIKSSYSDAGRVCVLVRRLVGDASIFLRDSKYLRNPNNPPENEPILEMPAEAWPIFEAQVLNSTTPKTNHGQPAIEFLDNTDVVLHGRDGTILQFTAEEWNAFRAGLADQEFAVSGNTQSVR